MKNSIKKSTAKRGSKNIMSPHAFSKLVHSFTQPVADWQRLKPAQRNAFLLFCDKEVGEYHVKMLGNPRSKLHTATSLFGLEYAMAEFPALLDSVRAYVNYVERELKKAAKAQKKEETNHGKSNL